MRVQVVLAAVRLPDGTLGIGWHGRLPWARLAPDMKRFRWLTCSYDAASPSSNVIVMGRRTWDSLPPGSARRFPSHVVVVVLASDGGPVATTLVQGAAAPVLRVASPDLDTVIGLLDAWRPRPRVVSVIGGTALFEGALRAPWCSVAHVTLIEPSTTTAPLSFDTHLSPTCLDSWAPWASTRPRRSPGFDGKYTFLTYTRRGEVEEQEEEEEEAGGGGRHAELQYTDLVRTVLDQGDVRDDRTGTGTVSVFSPRALRFDLRHGAVPVLTTKRVFWRGVVEELLWFLRGSTDAGDLARRGVHIWDANGSRQALDAAGLPDRAEGDLGPCFVAGTPVSTACRGHVDIDRVRVGDVVHTHLGNVRRVTRAMTRRYTGPLLHVHVWGLPDPVVCTEEHPFYARTARPGAVPTFVPAGLLAAGRHFVGCRTDTGDVTPRFDMASACYSLVLHDDDWWWMLGLFVGCGCIVQERNDDEGDTAMDGAGAERIVFLLPRQRVARCLPRLSRVLKVDDARGMDMGDGTIAMTCWDVEASLILREFGSTVDARCLPAFVHAAPVSLIDVFMCGLAAASVTRDDGHDVLTPSRDLALDLLRLSAKLGHRASCTRSPVGGYQVDLMDSDDGSQDPRSPTSFFEGGVLWRAITHVDTSVATDVPVFNLSVVGDSTYVVGNVAVHNCYGFQWRHFGARYVDAQTDYGGQGVDQIAEVVRLLRTDPTSRRIILSAWNPSAQPEMALPPCHMMCQFYVESPDGTAGAGGGGPTLSCHMYQRSVDIGLGLPFNIASYALLTCLLAHVTGMRRGELVITLGDAHIYSTHIEALRAQAELAPRAFPMLELGFGRHEIAFPTDVDKLREDHFRLVGYTPHPSIRMPMAA